MTGERVVLYQILVWYCVIILLAGQMWLICIICAVVTCNVDAASLDSSLFCMTLCDDLAGWANVVSLYMCCGHMQCRCSIIIIMIIILYVVIILCMCTLHGWSILCKSVMLAPQYASWYYGCSARACLVIFVTIISSWTRNSSTMDSLMIYR